MKMGTRKRYKTVVRMAVRIAPVAIAGWLICAPGSIVHGFDGLERLKPTTHSLSDSPTSPEISTIRIPVTISLDRVFERCEEVVPKELDESAAFVDVSKNALGSIAIRYRLWRDPLKMSMDGNKFNVYLHGYYWIEVAQRIKKPPPFTGEVLKKLGSCGLGEEPREVNIGFTTQVEWGPDWRFLPKTTVQGIEFPNSCRMTILNLDETDRIRTKLTAKMQKIAAIMDEKIRTFDLRPRAERAWLQIQKPVRLERIGAYLSLTPIEASASPLIGSGKSLTTFVGLTALTTLVIGELPEESMIRFRPLPQLKSTQPGDGVHIVVNSVLPFAKASEQLRQILVGREYKVGENNLIISGVEASGKGDAVMLQLDFTGWLKGTAYLRGKLAFDPETNILSIRDLDLSIDTKDEMTRGLADMLLRNPAIRSKIAAAARWSLDRQIGDAKQQIRAIFNRQLDPSINMKGSLTGIRLQSLIAVPSGTSSMEMGDIVEKDAFIIQLIADGEVTIEIG